MRLLSLFSVPSRAGVVVTSVLLIGLNVCSLLGLDATEWAFIESESMVGYEFLLKLEGL